MCKEKTLEILSNPEKYYAVNAFEKYLKCDTKDKVETFFADMPRNSPHLLNIKEMAICYFDVGKSVNLGKIFERYFFQKGEKLGVLRDQAVNIIAASIRQSVKRFHGYFQGIVGGDKIVYGFGVNPHFSDDKQEISVMDRAILSSLEILKATYNQCTEQVKHLLISREIQRQGLSLDDVTDAVYEGIYRQIHDKIGIATETGREGRITGKIALARGINFLTATKYLDPKGLLEEERISWSVNGPTADLAGRLFDGYAKNDQLWVTFLEPSINIPLKSRQKPNDLFIYFGGDGVKEKDTPFIPYRVIGVKTFYHNDFYGKLPKDCFIVDNLPTIRSFVDKVEGKVSKISKEYMWLTNIDVPYRQRLDMFYHGIAKTTAGILHGLYEGMIRIIGYLDRKNRFKENAEYGRLRKAWHALSEFTPEKLAEYTLVHDVGRYSSSHGLITHPTRFVEEKENTTRDIMAKNGANILSKLKEYNKTHIPMLTRYFHAPFDVVQNKLGPQLATVRDGVAIAENWIEHVSATSYSEPLDHDAAFKGISEKFDGNVLLGPFMLVMGKETQHYKMNMLR